LNKTQVMEIFLLINYYIRQKKNITYKTATYLTKTKKRKILVTKPRGENVNQVNQENTAETL